MRAKILSAGLLMGLLLLQAAGPAAAAAAAAAPPGNPPTCPQGAPTQVDVEESVILLTLSPHTY